MITVQFNLSSVQIRVLLTFLEHPDTRKAADHGLHSVTHNVVPTLSKLCAEGYLDWHAADPATKSAPGYTLTAKGEMAIRLTEFEIRQAAAWFDGAVRASLPRGAEHDVAMGKAEFLPNGKYRRKKKPA